MVEDQILADKTKELEVKLKDKQAQLELELHNLNRELEESYTKEIERLKTELEQKIMEIIIERETELKKEYNLKKLNYIKKIIEEIIQKINEKYGDEIKKIKLDGEVVYTEAGLIFRPKDKNYWINLDIKNIIEKNINLIAKEI